MKNSDIEESIADLLTSVAKKNIKDLKEDVLKVTDKAIFIVTNNMAREFNKTLWEKKLINL